MPVFGRSAVTKKRLEVDLQGVNRQANKQRRGIFSTKYEHFALGAQHHGHLVEKEQAAQAEQQRKEDKRVGDETEYFVSFLSFSFT